MKTRLFFQGNFVLIIALSIFMLSCGESIYSDNVITPENPTNPVDPSDPTNPVDPSDPANPVDPSNPTNPVDPSNPTNPVDPGDPTNPVDPGNPTNPVDPGDPNNPDVVYDPSTFVDPDIVDIVMGCAFSDPSLDDVFIDIPEGWWRDINGSSQRIDAFQIAKREVTREAYLRCVAAGECERNHGDSLYQSDRTAVAFVSELEAEQYCEWIGGRLPTLYEWQYAASHDGTSAEFKLFPWGNRLPELCVDAAFFEFASESKDLR